MGQDKSSNIKAGLPTIEMGKAGRIDISFFRMDNGFVVIDQDTQKKSAITDMNDVESVMLNSFDSVVKEVREALNSTTANDNVDVVILVEKKQTEYEAKAYEVSGPAELGIDQLADIVNDIINDKATYGIPGMKRPGPIVSASQISQYLQRAQVIKVKHVPDFRGDKKSPSENTKGKEFYHDASKNQNQQKGNQGNQGNQPKEVQSTKID